VPGLSTLSYCPIALTFPLMITQSCLLRPG
jgi:hypothetical protein